MPKFSRFIFIDLSVSITTILEDVHKQVMYSSELLPYSYNCNVAAIKVAHFNLDGFSLFDIYSNSRLPINYRFVYVNSAEAYNYPVDGVIPSSVVYTIKGFLYIQVKMCI